MGGLFLGYTMLTPLLVNWLGNDNWDSLVSAFYRARLANAHSPTVGNGSEAICPRNAVKIVKFLAISHNYTTQNSSHV